MSLQEKTHCKSIRILFNTPNPSLHGGPPTHLPILARALADFVELHHYDYGRRHDTETRTEKILGRTSDLARLRSLCRRVRPHLIHHNSAFDDRAILRDAPLMLVARSERVPVFVKIHGSWREAFREASGWFSLARQTVLKGAACIGVLSTAEKEEFERAFPVARGKVCVVKNVVSKEFGAVARREASKPTILFLSRLIQAKGCFDLLRAAPRVLEEMPDAEFLFVGDGEDARAFDGEISRLGLEHSVKHIPQVEREVCPALYAQAWVFVFPTHLPEGMPMVIGEALAAGVPVVATPTRFSKSYLMEGQNVLHVRVGDVGALAGAIVRICRDAPLRERMSRANRTMAKDFEVESVVREYVHLYRSVITKVGSSKSLIEAGAFGES